MSTTIQCAARRVARFDLQTVALDPEVQNPRARLCQGAANRRYVRRIPDAEQAPTTPGAAHFPAVRACASRVVEHRIDLGSRDTRGKSLAVVPFVSHVTSHRRPLARFERGSHRRRDVADSGEAGLHGRIAVDMPLGHIPVVDAGMARGIRVRQRQALLEILGLDRERDATHSVNRELHR